MPAVSGRRKTDWLNVGRFVGLIAFVQALLGFATCDAAGRDLATEVGNVHAELSGVTSDARSLQRVLRVIERYESEVGPLFVNAKTRNGFKRPSAATSGSRNNGGRTGAPPANELEMAHQMFQIQQAVIDLAYTPENLSRFHKQLTNFKFRTATYFPGMVPPPKNGKITHDVKINASHPKPWGVPTISAAADARRPTGCYLAPGSIGLIAVPKSMIGKGYSIRVGAHSWDLEKKPMIKRLDRVSIVYPITRSPIAIANPLGGNIYVDVPVGAKVGVQTVQVRNAVRSPFFSARSFEKTTLKDWQQTQRRHPGPWADFESDKFMMQVPSEWIRDMKDPVQLMNRWDKAMDAVSELFGYPLIRSKTVLYVQADVIMRGSANFPGYPQSNYAVNPYKIEAGKRQHSWMISGPQQADWTVLHELGHEQGFSKFRGETEAVVNLPHVAVMNRALGVNLDTAFGDSVAGKKQVSIDQAAIMWMITENFRNGKPMNHSNKPGDEFKYQHRGYAKYADIAYLFGWEALGRFWHADNMRYRPGDKTPVNNDPVDGRILRLSKAAGADLRPLIHFWGIPPQNPSALAAQIRKAKLPPAPRIKERLMHYKTIIPADNAAYKKHARLIFPRGVGSAKNPLLPEGWYRRWLAEYDQQHAAASRKAVQQIIDGYFK